MTILIERVGDLFSTEANALAHGVNTEGLMGAGIAVPFKRIWPEMYERYKKACADDLLKPGGVFIYDSPSDGKTIYNIASQQMPGPDARLEWFESGLRDSIDHAKAAHIDLIAMPRIGCGIGGLDWADVRDIVEHYASKSPVDIEVWSLE